MPEIGGNFAISFSALGDPTVRGLGLGSVRSSFFRVRYLRQVEPRMPRAKTEI
jgi:hypothetical protein